MVQPLSKQAEQTCSIDLEAASKCAGSELCTASTATRVTSS